MRKLFKLIAAEPGPALTLFFLGVAALIVLDQWAHWALRFLGIVP